MTIPPCFYRVSIKALIHNEKGEVLFLQEDNGLWELPGGGLEHGETFQNGLERELQEECGLQLKEISTTPTYVWTKKPIKNNREEHWVWLVFSVTTTGEVKIANTEECVDARFFPLDQLHTLTLHPNIEPLLEYLSS